MGTIPALFTSAPSNAVCSSVRKRIDPALAEISPETTFLIRPADLDGYSRHFITGRRATGYELLWLDLRQALPFPPSLIRPEVALQAELVGGEVR